MNLEILKKNIVIVPVIIAILSGTIASVRYVLNLTNTINASKQELVDLRRDLNVERDRINKATITSISDYHFLIFLFVYLYYLLVLLNDLY